MVSSATTLPASEGLEARRKERRLVALLLALGLVAGLAYFATQAYLLDFDLGFPLDDSWIHLQFARNLAEGHGLSYNPGELVTGSTAPLWTALLALLFLLPGSTVFWVQLLGLALYLAGIHATYRLARELDLAPGLAALAAGLALATSWLVWSALSGMEVPLFVLLSLWGMILHLRERRQPARPPLSLAVLGLAVLARPEGALLLVLAVVDRCFVVGRSGGEVRLARPPFGKIARGLVLAACALAGPLAFYELAGGSVLPTTYAVKGSALLRWLPEPRYLYVVLGILFRAQPWMVLFAGAGLLALVARLGTDRDRGLLPALWLLGLPLAYSFVSPLDRGLIAGNFGRYYFPLFPVLAVVGAVGLERAAESLPARLRAGRLGVPIRALAVLLVLWPTVSSLVEGAGRYAQNVANVQDSDVRVARWLAGRLPPGAVLAVNDIGALKYLLPNRIVDLVGIATPEARRAVGAAIARGETWERGMLAFLAERRPDYVVIFPSWFPGLASAGGFAPVYSLRIPDNITMGGDRIVVYRTPWTRFPLAADEAGGEPPDGADARGRGGS